jgi:hypothetical protein
MSFVHYALKINAELVVSVRPSVRPSFWAQPPLEQIYIKIGEVMPLGSTPDSYPLISFKS